MSDRLPESDVIVMEDPTRPRPSTAGAVPAGVSGVDRPLSGKALRSVLAHEHRPGPRQGVHFGNVDILEHERVLMESPMTGAPRLAQGPLVKHTLRRMDSLELEREPTRHHKEVCASVPPLHKYFCVFIFVCLE